MSAGIHSFVDNIFTVSALSAEKGISTFVLPNNFIHIVLHEGPETIVDINGQSNSFSGSWICGQVTIPKTVLVPPGSKSIAVRLKPWISQLVFDLDLSDIIDLNVPLKDILPTNDISLLELPQISGQEKLRCLLDLLNKQLINRQLNPTILNAIYEIERHSGNIRVNTLAQNVGYSRRNLERRFKDFSGIPIKKFISQTRFRHAFGLLRKGSSSIEVTHSCGYFDQTHFITEFRKMTGATPCQFMKQSVKNIY